jgi:tetratricopeptide (TPR) repeat protein
MQHERWELIQRLYHEALELEQRRRVAFIRQACGEDEVLRAELSSLLAQAEPGAEFMEAPAVRVAAKALAASAQTVRPNAAAAAGVPLIIGRYRVLRLLGEGGMGAVYEAEQDQPRRVVALKIIKPGLASSEILRRFQYESQALGRLQHPGIAQIYEANTADSGGGPQPYFAMELIRGQPLLEYAAARHLNSRARLELTAKICDAVEHAHQRGVIHRDLKPGNILVDETGQPKILDFGVARVTESDMQHTRQTSLGQLVGTLAYMSPEQVLGDPFALDIRSDVYALGLTLYELLAGKLPYDIDQKPLHEAVGIIRDHEPARLSSIDRAYRGDIETIVAKALDKGKARRYGSAAAMAADIRHYLADEPITARPASAGYQLQKFARRHKALVAGTVAVFMALAAGVVVSTREAVRARTAETSAQAVSDFLQNDLLAQASAATQAAPNTKPDPDLKVRTALDRAAARIAGKFDRQPEVEAAIRDTIGQTYLDLGLYPEGRKQFERALDLRRRTLGIENPKTLKTMSRLGRIAALQDLDAEAEALLSNSISVQRRVLGADHLDTLYSMNALAGVYDNQGKYSLADSLLSQVLEVRRRILGPEHPDTMAAMNNLAIICRRQYKYAQSEALEVQALKIQRRTLGPEHPDTLMTMHNLSIFYMQQGKYALAEALARQTLEIRRRVLGPEHPSTLFSMDQLARVCDLQGKYAEAETLFTKTLTIMRRVLGPEDYYTLDGYWWFASTYQRQGKYALAEIYGRRALSGDRRTLGRENPETLDSAVDLALVYQSEGKFAQSEPLAREAVEVYRKQRPDDWRRFRAESLLGISLAGQKKYAEAEPLLLAGYQGMVAGKDHMAAYYRFHLDRTREWLVRLYRAWGKPEKASEWNAR